MLDALLTEQSVTRAAARLGVTQSAVSHALRKLRAHFGDELLVRAPGGFTRTARATRLAVAVRQSLALLERAEEEETFEPRTARRTFTIAMADFVALVLLTKLLARVASEAPGVDLVVRALTADSEQRLEAGTVDLLVAGARSTPSGCFRQKLCEDGWVTMLREDHPVLRHGLDIERFVGLRHVLVAPRGASRGPVDDALEVLDRTRRIALCVPQLSLAAFVVAHSDLVTTAVASSARVAAASLPVVTVAPPLALAPASWVQLWHERCQRDPGHAWLRKIVADVSAT